MTGTQTFRALVAIGLSAAVAPSFAQDDLEIAPEKLSLQTTTEPSMVECRRVETQNPASLAFLPLHRTFNDDFDEHPLARERWVPHYAGGAAWPEARYWGGEGSDFKRKTSANGEQQIYVDPRYAGRGSAPLGLDTFHVENGVLLLVSDSTNALVPGHCPSERTVGNGLGRLFASAQGRIIVTTFASHIHRVQQIIDLAKKHSRKVVLVGRSIVILDTEACESFLPRYSRTRMSSASVGA